MLGTDGMNGGFGGIGLGQKLGLSGGTQGKSGFSLWQ
jgi:hypothetical protein